MLPLGLLTVQTSPPAIYHWLLLAGVVILGYCLLAALWMLTPMARRRRAGRSHLYAPPQPIPADRLGPRLAALVAKEERHPVELRVAVLDEVQGAREPSPEAGLDALPPLFSAPAQAGDPRESAASPFHSLPPIAPASGQHPASGFSLLARDHTSHGDTEVAAFSPSAPPPSSASEEEWPTVYVDLPSPAGHEEPEPPVWLEEFRKSGFGGASSHAAPGDTEAEPSRCADKAQEAALETFRPAEPAWVRPEDEEGSPEGVSAVSLAEFLAGPPEREEPGGIVLGNALADPLAPPEEQQSGAELPPASGTASPLLAEANEASAARREDTFLALLAQLKGPADSSASASSGTAAEPAEGSLPEEEPSGEAEPEAEAQEDAQLPEAAPSHAPIERVRLQGFGVPCLLVNGTPVVKGRNKKMELLLLLGHRMAQKPGRKRVFLNRLVVIDKLYPNGEEESKLLANLRTTKSTLLQDLKNAGLEEQELLETAPDDSLGLSQQVPSDLGEFIAQALELRKKRQTLKQSPADPAAAQEEVVGLLEKVQALYQDGFARGMVGSLVKTWLKEAHRWYEVRYFAVEVDAAYCLAQLGQTQRAVELATHVLLAEPNNLGLVRDVLAWLDALGPVEKQRWVREFLASFGANRPLAKRAPAVADLMYEATRTR